MRSQNGSNNIDFNLEPDANAGMLFARNVASGQAPVQVLPGTSGKQVYGFEAPYQKMFDVVDTISASEGGGLPTKKAVVDVMRKTVWTGNIALIAALSNTRFSYIDACFCCLKNIISCFILQVVLRHQVAAARVC